MSTEPNSVEQLRLQLLANGYSPIRNRDKRTFMKEWPDVEITPDEIKSWTRRNRRDTATGLRVEKGLAVIDIDVNSEAEVNAIANIIMDVVPQLEDPKTPLLVRKGKGFKEAWYVRTDELFSRVHSSSWLRPGEGLDAGSHRVEIFGGGSPRQFGSFGPHTVDDDGNVQVSYVWPGASPADTRQSELPVVTKKQMFEIVDRIDAYLASAGWTKVLKSKSGESEATRVFDLSDAMRFELQGGGVISLDDMRSYLNSSDTGQLRCSASFLEGREAVNQTRCLVSLTRAGHVAIWDSATAITHVEAAAKPVNYTEAIDRVREKLLELETLHRNKIGKKDGAVVVAAKLLETHAYCKYQQADVVPIFATSMEDGVRLTSVRLDLLPHCDEEVGPRGGVKKINPVDIWMGHEKRLSVRGLRMRPDMPRPIYEENGEKWVNIYTPPLHNEEGGDAQMGIDFLNYLIPDAYERRWFTQWLAHKVLHPYIPGPAVVMVARKQGTGRGTLGEIITALLGRAYVKQLPFHMFAGKSYQSQYDDWGAAALMVIVTESAESNGGSMYSNKKDTYEHLKEKIEPKSVERTYVTKGTKAFTARHFTSYFIATNNIDALPIPAEDRRAGVIANGEPNTDPAYWEKLNAWLNNPANIAAFAHWLEAFDLSDYSPYTAPLMTETKATMVEMGGTDIDRGLALALEQLPGECFTISQAVDRMRLVADEYELLYPQSWQEIARRVIIREMHRVGERKGANWQPLIDGKRASVYARDSQSAKRWMHADRMREEVLKNKAVSRQSMASAAIIKLSERRATTPATTPATTLGQPEVENVNSDNQKK